MVDSSNTLKINKRYKETADFADYADFGLYKSVSLKIGWVIHFAKRPLKIKTK